MFYPSAFIDDGLILVSIKWPLPTQIEVPHALSKGSRGTWIAEIVVQGAGEDPEILRASPEMLTINTRFIPHSRSRETPSSVITYISFLFHLKRCIGVSCTSLPKSHWKLQRRKTITTKDGQLRFCCRGHATLIPRNNGHHKGPQVPEKLRSFGDIVCRQL